MLNRSTPISEASLRGLHPRAIEDAGEILLLLERARENRSVFHRGLNTQVDLETAQLEKISNGRLFFEAPNFEKSTRQQVFLNFSLEGRPYFFASVRTTPIQGGRLTLQIPKTIFYGERRDRLRRTPDGRVGDPLWVELGFARGGTAAGLVTDVSAGGIGLLVQRESIANSDVLLNLKFLDGAEVGSQVRVQLRNWRPASEWPGWMRIGAARTNAEIVDPIDVEYWADIEDDEGEIGESNSAERCPDPAAPRVLRFTNSKGEEIVGLIDSWGDLCGATAVVIPNGWGQTKEALLPLARTIVATFRASGESICVIRFDGVRKRGESHNDPSCRIPGREYLNYVFSQGAEDIAEVARYLRRSSNFHASSIVLVTFSAAAIEARKALADDRDGLISAWISVVGSPDVQSMTRAISGGIDFAVGCERSAQFGVQELLGVTVNIDQIVSDGEKNNLLFIEDSRKDMENINVPITWYHGRFDAWVDFSRVRDILSHGNTANRRLVVLPTGHQLKSSQQAHKVFQCIACEIARINWGKRVPPRSAHLHEIHLLRRAERARIPARTEDLRSFWRDYLIGRDQSFGFELLANSEAYRELMKLQIDSLLLTDDQDILDLGSGVGTLAIQLALQSNCPDSLSITSVDYIREGFNRAKEWLSKISTSDKFRTFYIEADLDLLHDDQVIPIKSNSFDAAIASLLLSYLENPTLVLAEIYRLLRPGGRLVISSLCRDADISKLYVESVAELRLSVDVGELPGLDSSKLPNAARNFLNDAAKILDLEEAGAFHFWEQGELREMVIDTGFSEVVNSASLGSPPQAFVVSARKP